MVVALTARAPRVLCRRESHAGFAAFSVRRTRLLRTKVAALEQVLPGLRKKSPHWSRFTAKFKVQRRFSLKNPQVHWLPYFHILIRFCKTCSNAATFFVDLLKPAPMRRLFSALVKQALACGLNAPSGPPLRARATAMPSPPAFYSCTSWLWRASRRFKKAVVRFLSEKPRVSAN